MSGLSAFAVAIAFLVIVHLFVHGAIVPGSGPGNGTAGGGANSTSNTIPPSMNNATGTGNSPGFPLPSGWPWWVPYVALGAIGVAISAFVLPAAIARRHRGRNGRPDATASSAGSALGSAISALDRYQGDDPRPRIIALYGELLRAVGHRVGPIEPKTARELSEEFVIGLGVSLSVAQELTDRFEEARYSQRPLGPEAVARTRAALAQALEELARSGPAP